MKNAINTNISKIEFEKRFSDRIIPVSLSLKYWEQSIFIGSIKKNKFSFYWKEAFVRNSFRTILRGVITETNNGCNLEFKYDKFNFTKLFTAIMSTCVILFGLILLMDMQFIGLIPIGISLLSIMLIVFKTQKSKERLFKKLMELADIKDYN